MIGVGLFLSRHYDTTVSTSITITTGSPLPDGAEGEPYSVQLISVGGTGAKTWVVTSGALPDGLGLSSSGLLSGTPAMEEASVFTVRVTDADLQTADKEFTLNIVVVVEVGILDFSDPVNSGQIAVWL